jgi:membrane protease YdiL (CAAX protease family)
VIEAPPVEPTLNISRPRPRLSRAGTAVAALVLVAFAAWTTWTHLTQARVEMVAEPEEALALVVARGMSLNEGLAMAPGWERRLHQLVTTDGSDDLGQAIAWYEELADRSLDPSVDAHLAVLYGEAGDGARVEQMTGGWEARGGALAALAPIVDTAYLGRGPTDVEAEGPGLADALPEGWFADRLALAWAKRVGDAGLQEEARRSLEARGRALLVRVRLLALGNLALVGAGLAALAMVWSRRHRAEALAVGRAPLPPPWTARAGVAVLIRGGAGAALVVVALIFVSGVAGSWLDLEHPLLDTLTWPLMYVPVLLLARRHLLAPAGIGLSQACGLRVVRGGPRHLLLVALAVVAVGALVTTLLTTAGSRFGLVSHWSEWFDAELAFGDTTAILASLAGSVLLAPFFEEIVFRGILFATLRRIWRAGPAIAISGAVFGAAHGYGALGFLDVALAGMLWAWAFEKTGSVWPGIGAHALTNLVVSISILALLR